MLAAAVAVRDHAAMARELVRRTRANGGLAPLDLERFWADQQIAAQDPFGKQIPQLPLGIMMNWECVFDELGVEEDAWRFMHDPAWALRLKKAYNDKAQQIVGRRVLDETPVEPLRQYPAIKGLAEVFGAQNTWHAGSWWLEKSAHSEDELKAVLDRVEECNVRNYILPENWQEEKARLMALGIKPPLYRGQRGPVTFAMSIYGVEPLIFLIMDNPELAIRFRDAIKNTMLEIGRVLDEEAGYTPEDAPRGFWFADDNCCMLNPEMYELFGYPVLKALFDRYAPAPEDCRYQHSDSAMGHLLPVLGRLRLKGVNFGPTLSVEEIRRHCPEAIIQGQLAPFTFSRNEEEQIVLELLRDFDQAMATRGLLFLTAGSINNGSRLTGMRLIMAGIQKFCRYEP